MSRAIHQLTIFITILLANSVVAQSSDVVLHLVYEVTGEKRALLRLPSSAGDRYAFADAMAGVLGIDSSAVTDGVDREAGSSDRGLHGTGHVPQSDRLTFTDQIDLSTFRAPLVAAGFTSMRLVVRLPDSPLTSFDQTEGSGLLAVALYSAPIEADQLGAPRDVRYGWRPMDIGLYGVKLVLPIFLAGLVFNVLLRNALSVTGPDQRNADFAFLRRLSHAHVIFWILWFFYVAFWAPLRFPAYAFPSLAPHTLALTFALVWLSGSALSAWIGAKLHRVTQRHADSLWTRRDMVLCGFAYSTVVFTAIQFFANPALVAFSDAAGDPTPSALLVLGLLFPLFIWAGHFIGRFLGIETRELESAAIEDRFRTLASEVGVKRLPQIWQVHFTQGYLAVAFRFSRTLGLKTPMFGTLVLLDARVLRDFSTEMLDAMIVRLLVRMKLRTEMRLSVILNGYILAAGAAAMGAMILVIEADLWGAGSTPNLTPIVASMPIAAALVGVLGWLHYTWAARRYVRREDAAVLEFLSTPEEQIRGIFREAVLNCRPLEADRWWWLRTEIAPLERAKRLSTAAEVEVAPLLKEVEQMPGALSAEQEPSPILDLSGAINTQVILAMVIILPLFVAGPVAAGFLYHEYLTGLLSPWVAFLLGSVACATVNLAVADVTGQIGYRRLASALAPLASSPGERLRYPVIHRTGPRQQCRNNSAGVLQIFNDSLVYYGDDTQFEVFSSQIRSVTLTYFGFCNIPALEACVSWVDTESGECRESRFSALDGRTQIWSNETVLRIVTELERALYHHASRQKSDVIEPPETAYPALPKGSGHRSIWLQRLDVVFLSLMGLTFLMVVTGVCFLIVAKYTGASPYSAWFAVVLVFGHFAVGGIVSLAYRLRMNQRLRREMEMNKEADGHRAVSKPTCTPIPPPTTPPV